MRRTWPQRFLISFNVICIVGALVGAGSLAYAKRVVGDISRVKIDSIATLDSQGLGDQPRNFLIVGADSDDGLAANDPARINRDETVGGVRSDTIMIVRLDPKTEQAKVLSFPRDLWVDIPGSSKNRINAALQFGGPDLLISTIKANFDIDVNHYVQVNFAGFQQLVKLLDGVPVYFDRAMRDANSGLDIPNPGCVVLDEHQALSYVRSRHLKYFDTESGKWLADPTADLGRISRQQDFIKRVLRRAISQGARNPAKLSELVNVGVENITLDQNTTPGDLIALGNAFRNFDPNHLQTFSLPVTDVTRGGAAVLDLVAGEAEPTLALFRGTGEPVDSSDLDPSTIAVQVLNGSGKQDQAAEATEILRTAGFKTDEPSSATATAVTEVRYGPGQEAQAVLVARHLLATSVLVEDAEATQITVITGADFAQALLQPMDESLVSVPTTTTTTTTTAPEVTATTVAGTEATTDPASVTTTSEHAGIVPEAAPAGESCG